MQHKPKKSLGQNFLKSALALRKIIEAGEITPDDIILEIGPGKGALTEKLLEKVYPPNSEGGRGYVIAVEKDKMLFVFLKEKFAKEVAEGRLILVEEDILEFDITKTIQDVERNILERTLGRSDGNTLKGIVKKSIAQAGEPSIAIRQQAEMRGFRDNTFQGYKIIANIPYNITGAILKKFLTEKNQPEMMVLMVQHEVAKRIIATNKKESILSISVKAYGEPKMIMKVPARYFSPAPKVDSAVIAIKNISRKNFIPPPNLPLAKGEEAKQEGVNEEKFWKIVKAGFAHKRKKLSGNLKGIIKLDPEQWVNARAEDLTLADWIIIAK